MPTMTPKDGVRIVEVGPRDGLQNVQQTIPAATKITLIKRLRAAGLRTIELTSMVSRRAIPQLADCQDVLADREVQQMMQDSSLRTPVLVPNVRGLDLAVRCNSREVAVFVSASEGFSKANINCTVQEGCHRARIVAEKARCKGIMVRGYISCIFACPFDGPTPHSAVLRCVQDLLDMGCYEISLGDTTGVGVPPDVQRLFKYLLNAGVSVGVLAGHFHDTYGQAIANVWAAYNCGVRVFDSSIGGLGGCPYAPGAKGNLATEDLVYTLRQARIETGVNLMELVDIGVWISQELSKPNASRAGAALASTLQAGPATLKTAVTPASPPWTLDVATEGLEVFKSGPNRKLVLNRPRNGNSLNMAMISDITEFFEAAASDSSITRIALTANGKFFCTGMDLRKGSSPVAQGGIESDEQYTRLRRLFEAIDSAPQVTIACVQGPAFGGGVGLAFACDIRLLTSNASMTLSEVKLGLAPATISKFVIREWGVAFVREAMLSARTVSSRELYERGRVTTIVQDAAGLSSQLDDYLAGLKIAAPRASTLAKELVRLSWADGGGGAKQDDGIRKVFDEMMDKDGESSFGLKQFQLGSKAVDWDAYVLSKKRPRARL